MKSYKFMLLLCIATLTISCGREKSTEDISEEFQKKGTQELMEEASKDEYTPPEDGKLTKKQVEMYLEVREAEKRYAEVARKELEAHAEKVKEKEGSVTSMVDAFKGLGSAADFATADIRAAHELGYNTAEYQWVKGKVLEASAAAMTEKIQQASNAAFGQQYDQLKAQYDAETDPTRKAQLKQLLDQFEAQKSAFEQEEEEDAVSYNRSLLREYESEFDALAQEWSKFEENEGDAAEAMKNFEEKSDEAIAQSEGGQ